ncbi:hypothetical protein C449_04942 [Halococcus saccharolyticus DSM 5350]|uniref:DUF7129 domain-containing protein n=1 Tax=Halococcus saccharolyticus DSM 5350 TaxID=1227455 RepID=M0MKZ5_9EURY|nr:rubrerythrin-like domain-containing protein [Halococcus saccharolyticus]EMA46023.1 hypothetical protein C449_04942 [Halococcus saccharolyticus DSM 5350]
MARDVDFDTQAETPYECFECGTIVMAESNPGLCADCGSELRNRLVPFE